MRAVRYSAAGGVVVDGGRVLVLHRPSRGEVRLPKGHIELGESPQSAALREVSEESGYADLEIVADLGTQRVEFDYRDAHVVRDEHYFLMRTTQGRPHGPQAVQQSGERQFIPNWMSWDQALAQLTFAAEREWVRRAREAS